VKPKALFEVSYRDINSGPVEPHDQHVVSGARTKHDGSAILGSKPVLGYWVRMHPLHGDAEPESFRQRRARVGPTEVTTKTKGKSDSGWREYGSVEMRFGTKLNLTPF
jgi:hypothetical protein